MSARDGTWQAQNFSKGSDHGLGSGIKENTATCFHKGYADGGKVILPKPVDSTTGKPITKTTPTISGAFVDLFKKRADRMEAVERGEADPGNAKKDPVPDDDGSGKANGGMIGYGGMGMSAPGMAGNRVGGTSAMMGRRGYYADGGEVDPFRGGSDSADASGPMAARQQYEAAQSNAGVPDPTKSDLAESAGATPYAGVGTADDNSGAPPAATAAPAAASAAPSLADDNSGAPPASAATPASVAGAKAGAAAAVEDKAKTARRRSIQQQAANLGGYGGTYAAVHGAKDTRDAKAAREAADKTTTAGGSVGRKADTPRPSKGGASGSWDDDEPPTHPLAALGRKVVKAFTTSKPRAKTDDDMKNQD